MAADVRIGILGPLEVRVGFGDPVEVVGPRLRALVVRLALDPDRVVLFHQLVDALWGDDPPAQPANALQSLVSRLRRLLPDVVESHPAGYRLALEPEAVDAERFEALAAAGREELRRDPRQAGHTLREALALWRGPALADVAEAAFAEAAVARLEELRLGALEDRIEADLATGSSDTLVAELDELVTEHPLRERLCGLLMRALARTGRQAEALAAYERLRARLSDELGIDPSEELKAVHLAVLRGEAGAAPAEPRRAGEHVAPPAAPAQPAVPEAPRARTPPTARTNLRAQITSFVGRDEDLTRITDILTSTRLVTLTGPGGAGKTRLAAEAAGRMLDRMPDGVWMVELGPVADPGDLPQAVLSLLGAREVGLLAPRGTAAVAPVDRLVEALGDQHLLLVLDNCEHLIADVAVLVDLLLGRCAGLRVLATSREPLGITGEVLHPVTPLALPEADVTPAEALRYPAVRLFADRGAAARPGFTVDEATVGSVVRICQALDGIPLAIELAAARLRALSTDQVAARLGDRFRLLAGTGRGTLPRHQTLRAVVDWSWELLGDAERILLRRLSVFAGGASLDAAERVCAGSGLGGLAADEVLYLLASLVDKSLVVAGQDEVSHEVRYSLLETVRAYGEERRREAGEDEALRRAHAAYYLDLAERSDPQLRTRDQLAALARLAAERDNISAALRWSVDSQDAESALRFVGALGWYWYLHSIRVEGREWAEQALALPVEVPPALRAQGLVTAGLLGISGGSAIQRSVGYFQEALKIVQGLPRDEPRLGHPTLAVLPAMASIFANQDVSAVEHARSLRGHPDPWLAAVAHLIAGQVLLNFGVSTEAEAELDAALAAMRRLGERWGIGHALAAVAELSAYRGEYDRAVTAIQEAQEIFAFLGDREDVGGLMIRLAQTRARKGDTEQARRDLQVAQGIAHEVGAEDQKMFILHTLGDIARWEGNLDEARELIEAATARRHTHPIPQLVAILLVSRSRLEAASGNLVAARDAYEEALRFAVDSKDQPVMARVIELAAELALQRGDPAKAATLLGTAETLRGMPDDADVDVVHTSTAARAALGEAGYAQAYERGTARQKDDVIASLAEEVGADGSTWATLVSRASAAHVDDGVPSGPGVRSGAGTPEGRAGRTRPR